MNIIQSVILNNDIWLKTSYPTRVEKMKRVKVISSIVCLLAVIFYVNTTLALDYTYTEVYYPGQTVTNAIGINNEGVVVGSAFGSGPTARGDRKSVV